mmetsp:Transcript_24227/g.56271  ORF Transcript_24227/g.56271 Transcript_24227/m.56271 type:complete len:164 (+) Transcript_24227:110-601(+)
MLAFLVPLGSSSTAAPPNVVVRQGAGMVQVGQQSTSTNTPSMLAACGAVTIGAMAVLSRRSQRRAAPERASAERMVLLAEPSLEGAEELESGSCGCIEEAGAAMVGSRKVRSVKPSCIHPEREWPNLCGDCPRTSRCPATWPDLNSKVPPEVAGKVLNARAQP